MEAREDAELGHDELSATIGGRRHRTVAEGVGSRHASTTGNAPEFACLHGVCSSGCKEDGPAVGRPTYDPVIAGMEGALPSIVGGLVDKPIIAVPTSVGYGASFNGLAALLGMLTSCASGVSVVNIDNGFGAAYMASMINKL